MTGFEEKVIDGLARLDERIKGLGQHLDTLTERFDLSEGERRAAQTAHAERFGRIEAALARPSGTNAEAESRLWRRVIARWGPTVVAALLAGAASGGAVRVTFGEPAAAKAPAGTR